MSTKTGAEMFGKLSVCFPPRGEKKEEKKQKNSLGRRRSNIKHVNAAVLKCEVTGLFLRSNCISSSSSFNEIIQWNKNVRRCRRVRRDVQNLWDDF